MSEIVFLLADSYAAIFQGRLSNTALYCGVTTLSRNKLSPAVINSRCLRRSSDVRQVLVVHGRR